MTKEKVLKFWCTAAVLLLYPAALGWGQDQPEDPYAFLSELEEAAVLVGSAPPAGSADQYYSLAECVVKALADNHDIRKAQAEIAKSQGLKMEARAALLPKALVHAELSQVDEKSLPSFAGTTFGNDQYWRTEIVGEQPLFTGGAAVAGTRQAYYLGTAAKLALESVINDVVLLANARAPLLPGIFA